MIEPIETERLLLREIVVDDAADMVALNDDPDVARFTGDGPFASLDAARAFFADYRAVYATGFGRLAVVIKQEPGVVVGFCGLKRLPDGDVDLGYRLIPRVRGRGIATEAGRASIADGFGRMGLARIVARAHVDNPASHRVLAKCGMRLVGPDAMDGAPALLFEIMR